MSISGRLSYSLAAVLCLCAVPAAAQTTLNFEYPPPGYTWPVFDGYGGFHWGATTDPGWFGRVTAGMGGGWVDPAVCAHDGGITCAFNDGPVGGGPVSFWRDTPFNFLSLLMANYQGAPSVTVYGYRGANQVYSTFLNLGGPLALETFNWVNVDRVAFDVGADNSRWFLADDLKYSTGTVTPEPATMMLLGTGLMGIVGAGLLRRRKNAGLSG
jgi:hypothetical protein